MMVAISPQELLGTSDVIVVGTVMLDTRLSEVPAYQAGQATVRVDRVLKGTATGNIAVRHAVPPVLPPGMIIADHGGFTLEPQSQYLFYLVRGQGGYTLVGGLQGRKPAAEADNVAQALKEIPLTVTLKEPLGPCYFGKPFEVTITVTNHGAQSVQLFERTLEGFFYSARAGTQLDLHTVPTPAATSGGVRSGAIQQNLLEAGHSQTMALQLALTQPESWKLLDADTYFLTPVAIRARIFVLPVDPNNPNNTQGGYHLTSTWVDTLAGYPPPAK